MMKGKNMDQFTIMRRANGELYTFMQKGEVCLGLWPNQQCALRFRWRYPKLRDFIPSLISSAFAQEKLLPLQKENLKLYLLDDTLNPDFGEGHKLSWEELADRLPASSWVSANQLELGRTRLAEQKTPTLTGAVAADSLHSLARLDDDGGKPATEYHDSLPVKV
jgi:hypothetical protein